MKTNTTAKVQIVIAWTKEDYRAIGEEARIDLGERRKIEIFAAPAAAMWKNCGNEADVEKANAYAAQSEGRKVFVYPKSVRDPLGQAKKDVLAVR